jgi:hypothetical protein
MRRYGYLALVAVIVLSGCSKKQPSATPSTAAPTASAEASASPSAGPSSSASPTSAIQFTVDGAGPYQLGTTFAALQGAAQLDEVATGNATCPENTTARGMGVWKDIRLSFRKNGTLYLVVNRSASIPTPSGAWLGNSLAALESIYGNLGQELVKGTFVAYLVQTGSGRAILFDLDASKKTISMIAGEGNYLKSSYLGGTDYC